MLWFLFSPEGRKTRLEGSVWQSRGPKPALSRAHDGCCQYGIVILLLTVANSRCPAKSGKNKQTWQQCFAVPLPASGEPLLKDFLVSLRLIPLGGSFSGEFLCFSNICKNPAPTKSRGNEIYGLITPCVKRASPFDAETPTHSCILWALLRHHSCRQPGRSGMGHGRSGPRGVMAPTAKLCATAAALLPFG